MGATERWVAGVEVGPVGFGAMELSIRRRPEEAAAARLLHQAFEAGVRLVDTAAAYCLVPEETGHNERLVARALATYGQGADSVLVATKGGQYRAPDGSFPIDGRPDHLRVACERTLRNLGVDVLGLHQLHRPDPAVPFAESVGALADLQREGKVRAVGLSNVDADQLALARTIVDVASVQNELSPDDVTRLDMARLCAADGIAFLAYSPFGGRWRSAELGARHPTFADVARRHGVSPHQVALAWIAQLGATVVPIPGAKRAATLCDSLAAGKLRLTVEDLELLP